MDSENQRVSITDSTAIVRFITDRNISTEITQVAVLRFILF